MNTEKTETSPPINARRRLMRGVFAAPLALPLHSAALPAVQSLTCVARQVNVAPLTDPTAVNGSVGSYVRVKLWTTGGTPANTDSAWVKGMDLIGLLKMGTTSYLGPSDWQCFSAGSASGFTPTQIVSSPPSTPGASPALAQSTLEVAVRFDANGNIVGIIGIPYTGMGGTSAITGSCWTSFKP